MSIRNSIEIHSPSKRYVLGKRARGLELREQLTQLFAGRHERKKREVVWALSDVSFNVPQRQVIGIIGRNGAGKSTLLKILFRITHPTSGSIRVCWRVASLPEVGTGFHEELTGRENIYLNGSILGSTLMFSITGGPQDKVMDGDVRAYFDVAPSAAYGTARALNSRPRIVYFGQHWKESATGE